MKKKLLKFLLNIFLVLLSIPFAITFLFREPLVQTISARLATEIISDQLGYSISVRTINIDIFEGIELKDMSVKDHHDKMLLGVEYLKAKPAYVDYTVVGLAFLTVDLQGAEFRYGRYLDESEFNLTYLLNTISGNDTSVATSGDGGNFKLMVRALTVSDSRFEFFDENNSSDSLVTMDYAHMVFDSINIVAKRFVLINDSLNLQIEKLSTQEKCGLNVKKLAADFSISGTGLHAHNLLLKAGKSDIDMDLDFNYASWGTYSSFIDSVEMIGNFRPTYFEMSDAGYFSETMLSMPNLLGLSGMVKGTVSNLRGSNLKIHFGDATRFSGNALIQGLPDFYTSYMRANINEFVTTPCEAKMFQLPIDKTALDFLDYFSCYQPISVRGNFTGYYADFVTNLTIQSKEGNLEADVAFKQDKLDTIHFSALLQANTIKLGKLLKQQDLLGNVTTNISVSGKGKSLDDLALTSKVFIQSLDFMGYKYKKIQLDADLKNKMIRGHINSKDANLLLDGDAVVTLSEQPDIRFIGNMKRIYLSELLALQDDFAFSTYADIHFTGLDPASLTADIQLDTTNLIFGKNIYYWKNFTLTKDIDTNNFQKIGLNNDFITANLTGKYNVVTLPAKFQNLINNFFELSENTDTTLAAENEYATLYLDIKNSNLIETEFVPGLYISPNTVLKANVDFGKNKIAVSSSINSLNYAGMSFNNNKIEINTLNKKIQSNFNSERIILKDSSENDKTVFGIDDFSFKTNIGNDSLQFGIYWKNRDTLHLNSAVGEGLLAKVNDTISLTFARSEFVINDTLWKIGPENLIIYDSSGLSFRKFEIYGGGSQMSINGKIPRLNNDSIEISFKDFNISNLDMLTKLADIDLNGKVNGSMEYAIIGDNPTFISDLNIDDFVLNNEYLGDASILNTWDNNNKSISVNSQITRSGNSGTGEVFSIKGLYFPYRDKEAIDLDIEFNRFKLVTLEPILQEFVRNIEGSASGMLKVAGTMQKPELSGKIEFYRTSLMVNYLNTKYSFSNDIVFEPDKINLGDLIIYDTLGNKATIEGSLYHSYFADPYFDFTITTDRLLFFNTSKKMNDLYYGTAITSGKIRVVGNPRDISLDMNVSTADGTNVYLPLDYSVEISDKDYIIFKQSTEDSLALDSIAVAERKRKEAENLKYNLGLRMNINPNAKLTIFLPSDMGKIESVGEGDLSMKVNSEGDFSMIGDYNVEKGVFNFALGNLVQKRFELVKGGRISWSGDPYTANVRMKGLYKVKTSISNLGIPVDSSSNFRSKVTVECYVVLSDQLLNPNIRFEIRIPDLNSEMQSAVFATLDTTNQAMMNEQMISLLVLGTFSFSNANSISLSSSYYTVLSNQLSSMLSRLSDAVDIGVNYKPGDNVSQNEWDVALSTQFLDDRLIVEGNFGMAYENGQQNASNIVGDVDISYNLTKDGRWILKGYNHSNVNSYYNYSNYDKYAPYTQGVGIAFRKDFNKLAELFQRTRPKKKDMKEEENADE